MSADFENIENLFFQLVSAPEKTFPLPRKKVDAPRQKGVYIILSPRKVVVHVGRTPRAKGGIAQRLNDHLTGSSSFKYHYLRGNGTKLRGRYTFRCLVVRGDRDRARLEAYAIARLNPVHLGLG